MKNLMVCIDFIFVQSKWRFLETLASLVIILLCGILYNIFFIKEAIYNEHSGNKVTTVNSVKPLKKDRVEKYQDLLNWFITEEDSVPESARDFIEQVKSEAKNFITKLNAEMERLNDMQTAAVEQAQGNKSFISNKELFEAITNSYKNSNIDTSCSDIFEIDSTVKPQGLTGNTDVSTMVSRSEDRSDRLASLNFSIISSSKIPPVDAIKREVLKEKWWQFKPTCHLFNTFDDEVKKKIQSVGKANNVNDTLTAAFAPESFKINEEGKLETLDFKDPDLRVRAVYVGVDKGSRVSFPGTKFTSSDQVLYNPKDRPWFKLIHNDPKAYIPGDCVLTRPYADIGSQLLVVRTIVCKGVVISKQNSARQFALGIDLAINKSRELVNKDLRGISNRISQTAEPYLHLKFETISNKNSNENPRFDSDSIAEKIDAPSFTDFLAKLYEESEPNGFKEIFNMGALYSAVAIFLLSALRLRLHNYVYARLIRTTLFGDEVHLQRAKEKGMSIILTKIIKVYSSITIVDLHKSYVIPQKEVRARQISNLADVKSFKLILWGLKLDIPYKIRIYQILSVQNRSDAISIAKLSDLSGNKIVNDNFIKSKKYMTDALATVTSEPLSIKPYVSVIDEYEFQETFAFPSVITGFSSVKKYHERESLLIRNRIRLKTDYLELKDILSENTVNIVNKINDLKSALRRQPDDYFNLISHSNSDISRYILCTSDDELNSFKQDYKEEYNKVISIHKERRSSINFMVVPSILNNCTLKAEMEQFILMENVVIVLQGFEKVISRGEDHANKTFLTGYASWNMTDLNFYRIFLHEIKNNKESV